MDIQKQKEYFAGLEKELTDRGLEHVRVDGAGSPQVGDTIRFLLPMSEEGGVVMMELLILDLGEEEFLLEFYTTMFTDVEDVITDLSVEIPAWNFLCPLGSFGIFEEEGHLYHKYGLPFSGDTETEKFTKDSVTVMKFLFDIIADKYAAVLEMMIEGE